MESSRRDLLNDMAEHKPILKNNQNTYHTRFGFTPKTGVAFPKTRFCFYCVIMTGYSDQNLKGQNFHVLLKSASPAFSHHQVLISKWLISVQNIGPQ